MLRVLHVCPFFPPHLGGLENHVDTLSREQAALGMEVGVMTSDRNGGSRREPAEDGRQVERLPSVRVGTDALTRGLLRRMARARPDYDLLHLHGHHFYSSSVGALSRRLSDLPAVLTFHGDFQKGTPGGRRFKRLRDVLQGPFILGAMDGLIALTRHDRGHLVGMGADEASITIIPNGIDLDVFGPVPGERVQDLRERIGVPTDGQLVLFVGRLSEQKGVMHLLGALPRLKREVPAAHLVLSGSGPGERAARELVSSSGMEGSVTLVGRLSLEDLVTAYSASRVVAVPSLWEGMPLVILEAAACGRPVVASAVSGIPEFVEDGGTGLLVPPRDPDALASSLARALEDDAFVDRAGRAALMRAREEFDLKVQVRRTIDAYRGVVDHE